MRRKRVRSGLVIGVLLIAVAGRAQLSPGQRVAAAIDTVRQTGFYRIVLPPAFLVKCNPGLSDLRVYRSGGSTVPYVLKIKGDSLWKPGFLPIPDPVIRQRDSSNKHSYISLSFNDTYFIEQLTMIIRNPSLYKRMAEVSAWDDSTESPKVSINIDPYDSVFRLPQMRTNRLLIDISNEDNPPLVLSRISAAQVNICILVHLEKDHLYEVDGGDPKAERPSYDLHYFTDSMRQRPMDIGLGAVHTKRVAVLGNPEGLMDSKAVKASGRSAETRRSTILLWSVLVLVLGLLIYISVKMVKAIAKKETNDRL